MKPRSVSRLDLTPIAQQVSVVSELARNYFELRGAQWRLAVAQRSLTNQRETLRLTQLRRDAGVGEEQDVGSAAARGGH
jgi:outer membrane protein, multidrug efflux system